MLNLVPEQMKKLLTLHRVAAVGRGRPRAAVQIAPLFAAVPSRWSSPPLASTGRAGRERLPAPPRKQAAPQVASEEGRP